MEKQKKNGTVNTAQYSSVYILFKKEISQKSVGCLSVAKKEFSAKF